MNASPVLGIVILIDYTRKDQRYFKVRVPSVHGVYGQKMTIDYVVKPADLPWATVICPVTIDNDRDLLDQIFVDVGDIVYVEFIGDDYSYPIIVGKAYKVKYHGDLY